MLVFTRWKTGEWTDCSKTCNDGHPGERTRQVICVDESHDIETEDQESYCAGPKPVTREACALQACPAEWVTVKSGPVSRKKNTKRFCSTTYLVITFYQIDRTLTQGSFKDLN